MKLKNNWETMVPGNKVEGQLELEERRRCYKIIRTKGYNCDQFSLDKLIEIVTPLIYSTYSDIKDLGVTLCDVKNEANIIIVEFCSEIDINMVNNFDSYFIGYVKNRLCNFKSKFFTKTNLSFKHALSLDSKVNDEMECAFIDNVPSLEDEKKQIIYSDFYEKYLGENSFFLTIIEKKILKMNLDGYSFVDISEYFGISYSHVIIIFNKTIEKIKSDSL